MRRLAPVLAAVLASSPALVSAQARPATGARAADDLARARVLDAQGAKAYRDGRYNDAIRYFEEAHRLGGPPFELWNIAKCYMRLDQPEQAASVLERYLTTPALAAEERDEATQQLEALRKRSSTVTVASVPTGAAVTVDGHPAGGGGKTPTTFTVRPGSHVITLTHPAHAKYTQNIEARYGRAIILEVPLTTEATQPHPAPPHGATDEIKRIALRGDVGFMVPRYGSEGGNIHATLTASGTYRFADAGATMFAAGAMMLVTGDAWDNTINAPTAVVPCGQLKNAGAATALSFFAMGTAGWEIVPKLRAHAIAGLGLASYVADDLGGNVFVPTCNASPGVQPAILFGGQIDYDITPMVRLSALPVLLQFQPAFEGTRSTPLDTSGVWMRATFAIGAGVDL